jgi:hypothetical protein
VLGRSPRASVNFRQGARPYGRTPARRKLDSHLIPLRLVLIVRLRSLVRDPIAPLRVRTVVGQGAQVRGLVGQAARRCNLGLTLDQLTMPE